MSAFPRVGIVGGNGWIGGALARALVATGLVPPARLTLSCRSAPPDWLPEAAWTRDNQALVDASDVVVLAVRPQDWTGVDLAAPGRLVVSVMAAVPFADLAARTGSDRIVRALPNAAAEVGFSYTPWTGSAALSATDRDVVGRILASCGTTDEVPREADIDYLTCLSGTGPAYPALLAAALIRDAVDHGIPPEIARRAAVGILIGTGRLFERTGEDPVDTVAAFVDYRGVTAAAIEAMRAGGFDTLVSSGIAAGMEKAGRLSRPRA